VGDAAAVAMLAEAGEDHDVPPDVLTGVCRWLRKWCNEEEDMDPFVFLEDLRMSALEGATYCYNEGCEVVGHLKEFKVCPLCKSARYCGAACQKQDWTMGGHKETCMTIGK